VEYTKSANKIHSFVAVHRGVTTANNYTRLEKNGIVYVRR